MLLVKLLLASLFSRLIAFMYRAQELEDPKEVFFRNRGFDVLEKSEKVPEDSLEVERHHSPRGKVRQISFIGFVGGCCSS